MHKTINQSMNMSKVMEFLFVRFYTNVLYTLIKTSNPVFRQINVILMGFFRFISESLKQVWFLRNFSNVYLVFDLTSWTKKVMHKQKLSPWKPAWHIFFFFVKRWCNRQIHKQKMTRHMVKKERNKLREPQKTTESVTLNNHD